MKIYIPTLGRVDNQITFAGLPDKYKDMVVLVVQEHERAKHKHDVEYLVVGDNIGMSKTRQEIYFHAGKSRFSMYDDDLKFYRRNLKYYNQESDMEKSKRQMTTEDFDHMFDIFNSWLDEGMIQIGHKSVDLPPTGKLYTDITGVVCAQMINGTELSKFYNEVDWTYAKTGSDSVFTLEILQRGYKNRISDVFCIKTNYWQPGGCSLYRTAEMYNEENMKLVKKYLGYVKPKGTVTRNIIGEVNKFKFCWRDIYNSSQGKNLEGLFGE